MLKVDKSHCFAPLTAVNDNFFLWSDERTGIEIQLVKKFTI